MPQPPLQVIDQAVLDELAAIGQELRDVHETVANIDRRIDWLCRTVSSNHTDENTVYDL